MNELNFSCCAKAVALKERNKLIFERIQELELKQNNSRLLLHEKVRECLAASETIISFEAVCRLRGKYKALYQEHSAVLDENVLKEENEELRREISAVEADLETRKEVIEEYDEEILFMQEKVSKLDAVERLIKKSSLELKSLQEELLLKKNAFKQD
jgi:hypothetical protein